MCVQWGGRDGREGYENPVVFRVLPKPRGRTSEYGCMETFSLHGHVDYRYQNPTLLLFLKKFFKRDDQNARIKEQASNTIRQSEICPKSLFKVFGGVLGFVFFLIVNIILKTLSDDDCIDSSDELFECLFKYLAYEIICINCNKRSYKNLGVLFLQKEYIFFFS